MIKTGGWLVGLIAVAMVLAGCAHDGDSGSDLSTDERVEKAFLGLAADVDDPDGGRLSKMAGTFSGEEGDGTLTLEWGKNDVQYIKASMGSPGFQFTVESWCAGERDYTQFGGTVYESRRDASAPCLEMDDPDDESEADMDVGPQLPSPQELTTMPRESVTEQEDGSLIVTLRLEDGSLMTVTIDPKDRVKRVEGDQDGETVDIGFHYDSRRDISLPEADRRTPVEVEGHTTFERQEASWVAEEVEVLLPLSEFEVHVYEMGEDYEPYGDPPSYGEPVVAFPLDGGEQSASGYSFLFTDMDTDGKLSAGDSWAVTFPDGVDPMEHDVTLFDTWAGLPTDAQGMPAPGLVALLGVVMLGLLIARRR
ncbi:MAG: hypothetical protein KY455_09040 [Euryarchaeota archaeon]|nr:hypothetical protein [Euryarchaeota archaeon]